MSTFSDVDPTTGAILAEIPITSDADVLGVVARARAAQPAWAALPFATRADLLEAGAVLLGERSEEVSDLVTHEMGKPRADALREVQGWVGHVKGLMEEIGRALESEVLAGDGTETRVEREPLGVVAAITPWNFPLMIAIWHTMPALRSGNTVVIKPSEFTPLTTLRAAEIINEILPPGVFNIVTGDGSLGAAISQHPDINKIVFTGSTPTGKKIMESAAGSLKRITLELGGNDAAIVLPDTDVASAAPKIFATALFNNGQTCAALKRLYVHEDIYDEMCDALAAIAGSVTTGDGSGDVSRGVEIKHGELRV